MTKQIGHGHSGGVKLEKMNKNRRLARWGRFGCKYSAWCELSPRNGNVCETCRN